MSLHKKVDLLTIEQFKDNQSLITNILKDGVNYSHHLMRFIRSGGFLGKTDYYLLIDQAISVCSIRFCYICYETL